MYTKFRPWKQTKSPPVAGPTSETFASPCDQLVTTRETLAPATLQFINTAHPSEATSVKAIGAIRSHAAKEVHATRRQLKKQESRTPLRTQAGRRGAADSLDNPESRSVGCAATADAKDVISEWAGPQMIDTGIPSPAVWHVPVRRNPFNRLARPLNDVECFLVDYCMLATKLARSRPLPHRASEWTSESSHAFR